MIEVIPVILCGGSGTRLWPLSRSAYPKQFLALSGNNGGDSLLQEAIKRLNNLSDPSVQIGETVVVTGEDHRFLVLDQLQGLSNLKASLLLEPFGKNTAPALTLAALYCQCQESDPILLVTPADQTIKNEEAFHTALKNCIAVVKADSHHQTIAILGVTPKSPETGYGYIKRMGSEGVHQEFEVDQFVEKPDHLTAERYLSSGDYLWNSGVFVMRASTWLASLREYRPDILLAVEAAWVSRSQDHAEKTVFIRPDPKDFQLVASESIDYAVIEKCPQSMKFSVKVVELNAGWSDLGAWAAVWQVGHHDAQGNVISGDVLLTNTKNSLVHATARLVSTVGVQNLIVVETADAVLVADRDNSQEVKKIVAELHSQKRDEKNLHRKVARPWGWYDSIDEGDRFKVKRIQVKPGASLSLQMHHHRAEHWIVVKGIAEITNGKQVITLTENQSTFIPQGQTHRLANPGNMPLEIIEVQSGSYLGEDDIVRYEDNYGRINKDSAK